MFLLVFYISLALGVSFLCSVLEAVLLSVTPSFVAKLEGKGARAGKRLRELKVDIDQPLAAILSLNTVAHTIGAAGAGAQAQVVFGNEYVSIMSAILTLLILIVSEIIPKTLGAVYWKTLAPAVAWTLPPLIALTYPLVLLSQWFSRMVGKKEDGPTLDREEFSALAQLLVKEGVFASEESSVLTNLLRFGTLQATDIMTPRTVMVGFPQTETVGAVTQQQEKMRFSRFPIWEESPDHVTGLVLKHDMMVALAQGEGERPLSELRREIVVLPEDTRLPELLNRMLQTKDHAVLLIGKYGGTAGIVTLEDVVETLLGMEIVDEIDEVEDMQALARRSWEERARRAGLRVEEAATGQAPEEAAGEKPVAGEAPGGTAGSGGSGE